MIVSLVKTKSTACIRVPAFIGDPAWIAALTIASANVTESGSVVVV